MTRFDSRASISGKEASFAALSLLLRYAFELELVAKARGGRGHVGLSRRGGFAAWKADPFQGR